MTRSTVAAAAAAAVAVFVATVVVALHTSAGQRLDERAMAAVVAGREAELTVLSLLGRISIGAVLTVAAVCVALAVSRGRLRLAVAALGVIVGANVTTQVLKEVVLERSAFEVIAPNSLPSGHTTVVASAVGALLLVVPCALRLVVVTSGTLAVTMTGASTVVAGWHRPADIVAALAVCLAWTVVGSLLADSSGANRSASGANSSVSRSFDNKSAPLAGAGAGAVAGLLLLVAIGVRPAYGWDGFAEGAAVLGAMALAAVAVTAMERSTPSATAVTAQP